MSMNSNIPFRAINYEWETNLYKSKVKPKNSFKNKFGYRILRRKNGLAKEIEFSIYSEGIIEDIFIVGEFNNWGNCNKDKLSKYKLKKTEDFSKITIKEIKHNTPYLFKIGEKYLKDPSSIYFDEKGNSIFWDFEDKSCYRLKHEKPERIHTSTKILQTDAWGLVSKWFEYDKNWKTIEEYEGDLFSYIKNCGVLNLIKDLGFNTIQFLPLSQSIDGDNWKYRYLVTYPFAIHKSFGNPNSFLELIDECHKLGISVILDLVISHCPYKEFKLFNFNGEDVGLHNWKNTNGNELFLDEKTSWGTKRYNYKNKNIRKYLTESALIFLTNYYVDGFRIDNVDGILRKGINGQGEDRDGGRIFLRSLIKELYKYDNQCLVNLESHYFFGDNATKLVAPITTNKESLGATAYNSSRITYFFHKEYMPKSADKISIWTLEHIRKEKEFGKSNSTIADFHNHDAASGLMEERATGSFAFDAITLNNKNLEKHAIGKIQVMEAFIATGLEGRILDIIQTFLLQKGTFEHDSSIHWNKLNETNLISFKKDMNKLLEHPAFWPENTINREYINVDDTNKVLVIKRKDTTQKTNETFYILINFSGAEINNYSFGFDEEGELNLFFKTNNDELKFNTNKTDKFEFFRKEIHIEKIKAYEIIIFSNKN